MASGRRGFDYSDHENRVGPKRVRTEHLFTHYQPTAKSIADKRSVFVDARTPDRPEESVARNVLHALHVGRAFANLGIQTMGRSRRTPSGLDTLRILAPPPESYSSSATTATCSANHDVLPERRRATSPIALYNTGTRLLSTIHSAGDPPLTTRFGFKGAEVGPTAIQIGPLPRAGRRR